jgi:hypothetical protein
MRYVIVALVFVAVGCGGSGTDAQPVSAPTESRTVRCDRLWEQFAEAATNGIAAGVRKELQRQTCPQGAGLPNPDAPRRGER